MQNSVVLIQVGIKAAPLQNAPALSEGEVIRTSSAKPLASSQALRFFSWSVRFSGFTHGSRGTNVQ